tara:strand:+ start:92 stop:352 length:261 start_codon:yes stop_codon:yes gene_type:complete
VAELKALLLADEWAQPLELTRSLTHVLTGELTGTLTYSLAVLLTLLTCSWEEALVAKVFAGIDFDDSGEIDKVPMHGSSVSLLASN